MNFKKEITLFYRQITAMSSQIWLIDKKIALLNLLTKGFLALLPLGLLYITKQLIDILSNGNGNFSEVIWLIVFFALIQVVSGIITQWSEYSGIIFQQKVIDTFSERLVTKASKVDYPFFEKPAFHNTLHLAQQQAIFRVGQILPAINALMASGLSLLFLIVFFISIKAYFFVAAILVAIPISFNKWLQGKKLTNLEFSLAPKEREANYLFQILTGIQWAKELRSFQFGESFGLRLSKLRNYISTEKKKIHQSAFSKNLIVEILEVVLLASAIGYMSFLTLNKTMTIGLFVLYLQGFQRMQASSKSFFQSFLQIFQLRMFFRNLVEFFSLEETNQQNKGTVGMPQAITVLALENLSFTYPEAKTPILNNISINAKGGQIVAIVGENGAGKTTLVKILSRLYTTYQGNITINNQNIKQFDTASFYDNSGFFFQDYEKYFLEAIQNIHFNLDPNETIKSTAIAAAKTSGADEFIKKLSKEYQTKLGSIFEGSEQLSGGQWQKLALARIFYKKTKIVVLDEPSSSLDAFSELRLYEQIKNNLSNKIVILISHRLYNLKIADFIYVMKDGCIVQEGSFDELIKSKGLFQEMYEKQRI
jgi:ATP-binding cassette subfamily B protein